ncbi:hypothetical protein KP509_39G022900 [Ceratopteris richardii]|nr:hypothetical protein KP509_39G022900 [Ceratopteris richardii]
MSMAETHWTRLSSWQILFIAFGLLSWLFYLGLSWIASLPFFVQILFGATTGLVFMASYFNTQILRSQHRRRIAVNLAQLSTVDMVALQRLMPNHEKALSWVPNTSDVELVRWINAGLTKAWPYLKEASSSTLMVDLEKVCNKYKSGAIEAIKIKNLNLGKFCPYVEGVKAFRNGENKQICLEIQVDWRENGDQEILINVLTSESEYEVQVKDFIFYCVLRLTFTHLTEEFPCFAAVTFSIVEPPLIDFQSKLVSGDAKKILGMEKAVD